MLWHLHWVKKIGLSWLWVIPWHGALQKLTMFFTITQVLKMDFEDILLKFRCNLNGNAHNFVSW